MTGRKEPTQEEQRALIQKRMFLLDHGPGSRNAKRFNRQGVNNVDVVNANATASYVYVSFIVCELLMPYPNSGAASANPGVSPLDIKAAAANTLTPANNPTANNSLGLDDECVPRMIFNRRLLTRRIFQS